MIQYNKIDSNARNVQTVNNSIVTSIMVILLVRLTDSSENRNTTYGNEISISISRFCRVFFITARKRSLGARQCFYTCLVSVILSTGRGSASRGSLHRGSDSGRGVGLHLGGADHQSDTTETVNEQAVRILLECIPVYT